MEDTGIFEKAFYRVPEIAELLGISQKSVYRLIYRGHLKPIKGLRHKIIPKQEIENFIKQD